MRRSRPRRAAHAEETGNQSKEEAKKAATEKLWKEKKLLLPIGFWFSCDLTPAVVSVHTICGEPAQKSVSLLCFLFLSLHPSIAGQF